ncbi:MAG: glycosyltransferase [Ignavibacteria bacterium]
MLYVIFISYFTLHLVLFIGFLRSRLYRVVATPSKKKVTVVVAARNEEENIIACIKSLKALDYEPELLQIIIVNDSSTDNTLNLIKSHTHNYSQFKIIEISETSNTRLKGKLNALNEALKVATGEIIMLTDADCVVPPDWVRETVKYYTDNVGMVCGYTRIEEGKSLFSKLQTLDWLYLQSLAAYSSGINQTLSSIGNNLSYSKAAYETIGGYENIKISITEDLALLRAIGSTGKYKILYPINYRRMVTTKPCKNIKELIRQKKRWFRGGFGINMLGYILGVIMYITNFVLLTGFLYLAPESYLLLVAVKFISDLLIILPPYFLLKFRKLILHFFFFEIYFAIYGVLLPFTFIGGTKVIWKERIH